MNNNGTIPSPTDYKPTYEIHPYTGEHVLVKKTTERIPWGKFAARNPETARRIVRGLAYSYEQPLEVHRQQDGVTTDRLVAVIQSDLRQEYTLIGDTSDFNF